MEFSLKPEICNRNSITNTKYAIEILLLIQTAANQSFY